jgi:hypothetical protein
MDIANYHDYMMISRYSPGFYDDETNFVYNFGQCLRIANPAANSKCHAGDQSAWTGSQKPIIWGELDVGSSSWDVPNPQPVADHNVIWAGLFSPMGTVGIDWYWQQKTAYQSQKYDWDKIASDFFADIDYAGKNFSYFSTDDVRVTSGLINTSDPKMRVLAMKAGSNQEAYAWVQHRDYTWAKANQNRLPISGTFTVSGMANGNYRISYWNTHTPGTITDGGVIATSNGNIVVPVGAVSDDVAIKIVSTTAMPTITLTATPTPAQVAITPTPIIGDGHVKNYGTTVDFNDVLTLLNNWLSPITSFLDQYKDGAVNSLDFGVVAYRMLNPTTPTAVPSIAPTITTNPTLTAGPNPTSGPIPTTSVSEWTQFGHDSMRSNFTAETVATPWKFAWEWNGAGADGKRLPNHVTVADLVEPVTGGGRVYMAANDGLYALDRNSGSVLWTQNALGNLLATPVYDKEFVYVPSSTSKLFKINAITGAIMTTFIADSGLGTAALLVGDNIYIVSNNGTLYSINTANMTQNWSKSLGSAGVSPPSYSPKTNLLIVNSQNLYVHAINATDGVQKWQFKPTTRNYEVSKQTVNGDAVGSTGAQFDSGWPVVADGHGIVFVRIRVDWETLWTWNPYPNTNAAIRANLIGKPDQQVLFALRLSDGQPAFVPAVGNGGQGDGGHLPMGPQPIVKNVNGQEVAYIIWRNGLTPGGCTTAGNCCEATQTTVQSCNQDSNQGQVYCAKPSRCTWSDGREDATMGEMVLDNNTVSGYQAGDVRFVQFTDIQTDEMMNLSMSGDTIFHSHWLVNEAKTITDRSGSLGGSFINPIKTIDAPNVIWRQCSSTQPNPANYPGGSGDLSCPSNCLFSSSRYCSSLFSYGDSRGFPAGFYEYYVDSNSGSTPFTVVSNGLVLVKTFDGGLMALTSGSPTALNNQSNQLSEVLGTSTVLASATQTETVLPYTEAGNYVGKKATFEGVIVSAVNHRPKAIYLGFHNPHDGALLLRIFEKDLKKWNFNIEELVGKKIQVKGEVTLYWPENVDPEIVVTDPSQIKIIK